jgi:hypothetical protein
MKTATQILEEKGIKDTLFINEVWSKKGLSELMEEYASQVDVIKKAYSGVAIETDEGKQLRVCLRDYGFDVRINDGKWIHISEEKDLIKNVSALANFKGFVLALVSKVRKGSSVSPF